MIDIRLRREKIRAPQGTPIDGALGLTAERAPLDYSENRPDFPNI